MLVIRANALIPDQLDIQNLEKAQLSEDVLMNLIIVHECDENPWVLCQMFLLKKQRSVSFYRYR